MTAANFCIVLSEALAPAPISTELLKQLPTYAPNLVNYLDGCQSQTHTIDLSQFKCTALEYWQLQQAGFTASKAKHNAALALLLATQQQKLTVLAPTSPFWLVELVHISPARDGAALITAKDLAIEQAQNDALLASAQSLCEGTPFQLSAWSATHWQLHIDPSIELPLTFASSALMSRTTVNDWWDQDSRSREWRRFVNEIQMLYFDHPTNLSRQAQGSAPINSLWPVGGLSPADWQPQAVENTHIFHELTEPYLRQDWGQWLLQLQHIDNQLPSLLAQHQPQILLTNTTQYLHALPQRPSLWSRFFKFNSTPAWRNHWLAQS